MKATMMARARLVFSACLGLAALLIVQHARAGGPLWRCEAIDGDPVRTVACTERAAIYAPCEAVAVPVEQLRAQARVASDLTACADGRAEDRRAASADYAAVVEQLDEARADRDAAEARAAELVTADRGAPWWSVVLVGAAGVLAGVAVGLAL